jgi:hypothetical protein
MSRIRKTGFVCGGGQRLACKHGIQCAHEPEPQEMTTDGNAYLFFEQVHEAAFGESDRFRYVPDGSFAFRQFSKQG